MTEFSFVHMADPQIGLFAASSGLTPEEIARFLKRGIKIRPAPKTDSLDAERDLFTAAIDATNDLGAKFAVVCGDIVNSPSNPAQLKIAREIAAAPAAPHGTHGPDGALYPGICRRLSSGEREDRIAAGAAYAIRLDSGLAAGRVGPGLHWHDQQLGRQALRPGLHGDVVLARKDTPTSYHLAVTVDDALQGITIVTRGADLFEATHVHRLLQALLGLPTPGYDHHRLLLDDKGARLAKRHGAVSLAQLRDEGRDPAELRRTLGFERMPYA